MRTLYIRFISGSFIFAIFRQSQKVKNSYPLFESLHRHFQIFPVSWNAWVQRADSDHFLNQTFYHKRRMQSDDFWNVPNNAPDLSIFKKIKNIQLF